MGDKGPVKEDHWWERVFNEASSNVDVQKSANGNIAVNLHDQDGVEITNKSYSLKKLKKSNTSLQYGNFLKSATLLANVGKEEDIEGHLSTADIEIKPITVLSDEDLFKACNGRTAHKGARHGLTLSGKLQRIAEQEKQLLERMKNKADKSEVFREPLAKKPKKNPLTDLSSSKEETSDDNRLPVDPETDYVLKPSRKRRKKDKQQEEQLVTKIIKIELSEENSDRTKSSSPEVRQDTPVRKEKKAKRTFPKYDSIKELDQSSQEPDTPKRKKKKKGKRKLEDDEDMPATANKYLKVEPIKVKKVKLNDSYEASDDEEDVADKINAEQEARHSKKLKKKSKKAKQRQKSRVTSAANGLAHSIV